MVGDRVALDVRGELGRCAAHVLGDGGEVGGRDDVDGVDGTTLTATTSGTGTLDGLFDLCDRRHDRGDVHLCGDRCGSGHVDGERDRDRGHDS